MTTEEENQRDKAPRGAYAVLALLAVVAFAVLAPPARNAALALLMMVAGGIWGDIGKRFVVPLGAALCSYSLAWEARPYVGFFETSAQVVPVLILAAVVEQREALRDAARGPGTLLLFGATLLYMLVAEIFSLYAVGTCEPGARCAATAVELSEGFIVDVGDATLASWVAGGLGGGLASLAVGALLPPRTP